MVSKNKKFEFKEFVMIMLHFFWVFKSSRFKLLLSFKAANVFNCSAVKLSAVLIKKSREVKFSEESFTLFYLI